MKRLLMLLVCVCGLQAGFYVGVEGGYNTSSQSFDYTDRSTNPKPNFSYSIDGNGYVANFIFGTEHSFLDRYIVLRWGALGGFGQTTGEDKWGDKHTLSVISFGANADLITNFIASENFTLGLVAGVEYMYSLLRPSPETKEGATLYRGYTDGQMTKEDFYVSNKTYSESAIVRAGISTLIKKHHRFDVYVKIPFTLNEQESSCSAAANINGKITVIDFTTTYQHNFIQALISYKYVF